jgi:dCMP deaminase
LHSKWDKKYIELADHISTWSKDPSTKIGAVAVSSKGQVLATGYNGFPRGIEDSEERLNDRTLKYKYIVHAEKNVIYNATYNGVSLDGATVYVSGLPCCNQCALGLIQVGVTRVIMRGDPENPRWKESWEMTKELFNEANVEWEFVE